MLLRLVPSLGGDGTILGVSVIKATGSDMLTLFDTDLQQLGNIQEYTGWQLPTAIITANGVVTSFPTLLVQV